jgi:hypothetical protein
MFGVLLLRVGAGVDGTHITLAYSNEFGVLMKIEGVLDLDTVSARKDTIAFDLALLAVVACQHALGFVCGGIGMIR